MTAPRLFGIPAADAAVVAVLRRGPTGWCSVGLWDLAAMEYRQGSWLRGTLYPQRCDVSPDGRWLAYFCLKPSAGWPAGPTYLAVSRLPWLTALVAWGTGGTWTSGLHFTPDLADWPGEPDVGDPRPLRERYGLAVTRAASFAVERRRGWTETSDTPPRSEDDVWDQQRQVAVEKASPADGSRRLVARGWYAAWRSFSPERYADAAYALDEGCGQRALDGVQWADWAPDGRLLVATTAGELQVRDPDGGGVAWRTDLAGREPESTSPPPEASRW